MKICSRCRQAKDPSEFTNHRGSKDGKFCYCKICLKSINKENKEKHKEQYNATHRERMKVDPEYKEKIRLRSEKNNKRRQAAGALDTPEFRLARRISSDKYWRSHREQHMALAAARRQKFIREMTANDWRRIMLLHSGRCFYCDGKATGKDHVLPICLGGRDTVDNTIPCCPTCNKKKSSTRVEVWVTRHFPNYEEVLDRLQETVTLQRWLYARQEAA